MVSYYYFYFCQFKTNAALYNKLKENEQSKWLAIMVIGLRILLRIVAPITVIKEEAVI